MTPTKLITTIHWKLPKEAKEYFEANKDLHTLVFGGGKKHLDSIKDKWLKDNCIPDDVVTPNISDLNPQLNEMTTIYLIHNHLGLLDGYTANIGHVHYRRFFARQDLEDIDTCDGIIATASSLNVAGFNCTLEKQYALCHYAEDFQKLKQLIVEEKLYDADTWNKWTQLQYLYAPCNIFCLKRECFNIYCDEVFKVVLRLPTVIDVTGRDDYQKRACSFLSERLTSYWFFKQQASGRMRWKEKPCQFMTEWKAPTSGDNRGCYNGQFIHDQSMDKVNSWIQTMYPYSQFFS